jgi:hypothetical protein
MNREVVAIMLSKRLSTAHALLRRRAATDSGVDTSHCGTSYFAELMLTP